ncbi:MAG: tetratricopeptide repeat protein [Planctomycetaceae bacterium]
MRYRCWLILLLAIAPWGVPFDLFGQSNGLTLADAQSHLNRGRYGEAIEAFTSLANSMDIAPQVALGLSRAHEETGELAKARAVVQSAIKVVPQNARLLARLAELHFRSGRLDEARRDVELALKIDGDLPAARLVEAELNAAVGRLNEANEGFRWFIRYYNQAQPEDEETLLQVARGAVQYARWNRNTQIYSFVVNTLCPDALKKNAECWQAYELSGALLLEKYNREQSLPEFHRALAINPRAASVLVSLGIASFEHQDLDLAIRRADESLAVNPSCIDAFLLKTDVELVRGRIGEGRLYAEKAIAINPADERVLARIAACDLLDDGIPSLDELASFLGKPIPGDKPFSQSRFSQAVVKLLVRNAHPGQFFLDLGKVLEMRRQLRSAELCYEKSVNLMPQLPEPKTALGLLYMRTGKTDEARRILDEAFEADPYHIRVSNMRKVIRLLDGYEVISTDHFVIRVDSKLDRTLGRYMSEYLEEIYGELTAEFGFEPLQRTQFEIFNKSSGRSAHEWFSARMVGLPWIQTIGASTGMMVAMASPTAAKEPFNWARVLKHEFVHVITLQQTNFNIPHWFTEALAVSAEKSPRPELWDRLLLERVPRGEIRTLANLDEGFQRPVSPDDWQFAYCQSRLYAQLITEKYGAESIRKLLNAYRENLSTEKAIEQALGVKTDIVEKQYREFLDQLVTELRKSEPQPSTPLDVAERNYKNDPSETETAAIYADALLRAGRKEDARRIAEDAIQKNPRESIAGLVLARLDRMSGRMDAARKVLTAALDRESPHRDVVLLLAQIELETKNNSEAMELFDLGLRSFPASQKPFLEGLAKAAERQNDVQRAVDALRKLAELDSDNPAPRKKLAELALAAKNWNAAVEYGRQALFVDVLDAEVHRMLGEAWTGLGNRTRAILELETALDLKPGDDLLQLAAARAHLDAGEKSEGRAHLEAVLKRTPGQPEAVRLLKSLE